MKIDTGISTRQRGEIAQGLSRMLADTYLLYLKTHNFHWNVEGPMFQTLHTMFMGQYTEAWNAIDPIAERIRALGHYAPGTYKQYLKLGSIKETDGVPKAEQMVKPKPSTASPPRPARKPQAEVAPTPPEGIQFDSACARDSSWIRR